MIPQEQWPGVFMTFPMGMPQAGLMNMRNAADPYAAPMEPGQQMSPSGPGMAHLAPSERRAQPDGRPRPPRLDRRRTTGDLNSKFAQVRQQDGPHRSRSNSPHGDWRNRSERRSAGNWPEDLGEALAEWRRSEAPGQGTARARSLPRVESPRDRSSARLRARSAFAGSARQTSGHLNRSSSRVEQQRRPQVQQAALQLVQGLLRSEAWDPCNLVAQAPPASELLAASATSPKGELSELPTPPVPTVAAAPEAATAPVAKPKAAPIVKCLEEEPSPPPLPKNLMAVRDGASQTESEAPSDLCVICLLNPRTHASLPCGHRCWCRECAEQQKSQRGQLSCPLCREPLTMGLFEILDAEQISPDPCLPQWRRNHPTKGKQRRRVHTEALAQLQQVLLANTAKTVERSFSSVATEEAGCQTDGSGSPRCARCSGRPVDFAALPCGHRCLCERCAGEADQPDALCPVCNAEAGLGFFRIYD